MKRITVCSIVGFVTILFLSTILEAAYASYANNGQYALPDFLLRYSEYLSRGNASELVRIRKEMVQQERLKQERIKSTNGAVLHSSSSIDLITEDYETRYVTEIVAHSPTPQYDNYGILLGYIENWDAVAGWGPDGSCAELAAIYWSNSPPVGGEAFCRGPLNDEVFYWGDVYAWAKKGPLTGSGPPPPWAVWRNYLIIWVAYDPVSIYDWHYVGYTQVFSDEVEGFYVGSTYWYWYNYLSVNTWCPWNYYPYEKSSLYVDSVQISY